MSLSESHSAVVLELAEEFLERYRRGERPSMKEYLDRHPHLAAEIREVFPAMALMENIALDDESLVGTASGVVSTPRETPQQLGDFRILREVGRGGMGIVYEAEQISLGRHVALKLLPHKTLLDDTQKRRFEREAKAAARLHHTNIVPIFGVGEHEGTPYYVMQFIQGLGLDVVLEELQRAQPGSIPERTADRDAQRTNGRSIPVAELTCSLQTGIFPQDAQEDLSTGNDAAHSQTTNLSSSSITLPGQQSETTGRNKRATYWESVARIGVQVADALDHAHQQGILHRDIKPSNLLLDRTGRVWVTDFGLARAENEEHLTLTGDVVGTLRYMPPEAFEGRADVRGDVYALGLTLYELLALRPAFDQKDRHRLIRQVTTSEPPRLRKINRQVQRDLETIIHKAIEREPGHRYATAAELMSDLQRFLDDEPIRARRLSGRERLLRWGRRNKAIAVLSTLAIFLLAAVAVVSLVFNLKLLAEQKRANEAERAKLDASVKTLLTASPDSVPFILDTLKAGKQDVLPNLAERVQLPHEPGPHLRLNVALAVLGEDRLAELCARTAETPPAEAFNLILGLKAGERQKTVDELYSRYEQSKPGEGRTRLSIALLELGDPRAARTELAVKADPTERVRFIHVFATWHGDLAALPALLKSVDDPAFRSGLCLAAGSVVPTERELEEILIELYTSAPDGGTHSAAGWALRRRGVTLPELTPSPGPAPGRQWFVNRLGMTMLGLEPGVYQPGDYNRPANWDGPAQTVVLTRPLFMLDQEVTAAWYRRFLEANDHPAGEELTGEARQGTLENSLAEVNRPSAVLFCNWLSRREGRTPCYKRDPQGGWTCDFRANGYRLATSAEWEYAFRCGSTTRYVTGRDVERMLDHGRLFADHPGPGKELLPNPWGLFDMLGNAWELCWDQSHDTNKPILTINPVGVTGADTSMRGGSHDAGLFYSHASLAVDARAGRTFAFRLVCGPLNAPPEPDEKTAALNVLTHGLERGTETRPHLWAARGELYFRLGQLDNAANDYRRALQLAPQLHMPLPGAAWDPIFQHVIKEQPNNKQIWHQRLGHLGATGRWREAATASARLVELDSSSIVIWFQDAPLRLYRGDGVGYRRDCREMLARFTDMPADQQWDVTAKTCLLLPDAVPDLQPIRKLLERAVEAAPPNTRVYSWVHLSRALADYRAGQFDVALQHLNEVDPNVGEDALRATALVVRALIEQGRGRQKDARQALEQAQVVWDEKCPKPEKGRFFDALWHDWLRAEILLREAKKQIDRPVKALRK